MKQKWHIHILKHKYNKTSLKSQPGCYANTTAENIAAEMKGSLRQRSATLHRLKNDLCASSGDNSGWDTTISRYPRKINLRNRTRKRRRGDVWNPPCVALVYYVLCRRQPLAFRRVGRLSTDDSRVVNLTSATTVTQWILHKTGSVNTAPTAMRIAGAVGREPWQSAVLVNRRSEQP